MFNVLLTTVKEHNYLGICLHHKLFWKPHVDCISDKANRLLGFLKRNLYTMHHRKLKNTLINSCYYLLSNIVLLSGIHTIKVIF